MDITTFLAQIWGPIVLAMGVGMLINREYYIKIYRDLEKETLAVIVFGMLAMAVGIAQIYAHNLWNNLPQVIISFFGWATLLKGAVFLVAPKFVNRSGDYWVTNTKLMPVLGLFMLFIGAYLSWVGYFA